VDAADEAADPFQGFRVLELGRTAAATRINRHAESGVRPRFRAADRRDHGNLALRQLARELVFFIDLRVAPAAGAIELRHNHRVVLEPNLVHAVFVAVEAEQAAVRTQPGFAERVEHPLGGELGIRMRLHG